MTFQPFNRSIFLQQGLLPSPLLEMTQSTSQVTYYFSCLLCIYSGQEACDLKDCICRRMYLTWETYSLYWFPLLFALGFYCLIDGLFHSLSSAYLSHCTGSLLFTGSQTPISFALGFFCLIDGLFLHIAKQKL